MDHPETGASVGDPSSTPPSRTYKQPVGHEPTYGHTAPSSTRRESTDAESSRASTIIAREHGANRSGQVPEEGETWQDFLRRVPPQDIISRDPEDPVRQAYMKERKARALEEARKRRRSATSISQRAPQIHVTPRMHSSSLSLPRYRTVNTNTRDQHHQHVSVDHPLPRLPSFDNHPSPPTSEHIVPRWQPDHEVSSCPICGRAFGVFFRRHHCRKCGRVVCSSCSPHRITIPRQYIVHPPDETLDNTEEAQSTQATEPTGDNAGDRNTDIESPRVERNPALGGGQEVRLCNPCVPDPNPLPFPSFSGNGREFSSFPALNTSAGSQGQGAVRYERSRSDLQRSWEGLAVDVSNLGSRRTGQLVSSTLGVQSPYGSAPTSSNASYFPQQYSSQHVSFGQGHQHSRSSRHRSHASTSHLPPARHASLQDTPLPPTPPPPPPPIHEEDECPICHLELPPKGPNGEETARETHVSDCIASHFSTSGPRAGAQPPPEAAVAAAVVATAATPAQASGSASTSIPGPSSPQSSTITPEGSVPRARRRTTGMVVYHASEKDCIGGDGSQQECVICFEDFQVGDEMGRLECLCKFHRACIRSWWERKGAGSCPVHQDGI